MNRTLARMLATMVATAALTATTAGVTHASPSQDVVIQGVFYVEDEPRVVDPVEGQCYRVTILPGNYVSNQVAGYEHTYRSPNCDRDSYLKTFRPGGHGHSKDLVRGIKWTLSATPPAG